VVIFDTATVATQVKPWGEAMQDVFTTLRAMLDSYRELAIVLVLHLRKPQGPETRGISDVLGEWGRWSDVVVLMQNDRDSLDRVRLATRKRVKRQRRILVEKVGGLLVNPVDLDVPPAPKTSLDKVVEAVASAQHMTFAELATTLGVGRSTALRYVAEGEAAGLLVVTGVAGGGRGKQRQISLSSETVQTVQEHMDSFVDSLTGGESASERENSAGKLSTTTDTGGFSPPVVPWTVSSQPPARSRAPSRETDGEIDLWKEAERIFGDE
jgi:hypothetical protein